jgi:hypothetical protein
MIDRVKTPKKEIKDVEHAINHYPEYFDRPSQVLHSSLKRDEKIKLLRQWKYDLQLEEVAEEENMHSSSPDILDEIQYALNCLKDDEHCEDSPPTKTGGFS